MVQGPAPLLRSVLQRYKRRRQRLWPAADQLAYCKTLEITHTKLSTRASPLDASRQRKMILTTCAACAAPLAHDAPRCVRCHLRYCNKTCQHDDGATPDDLREAVEIFEEVYRTSRRLLGAAHPRVFDIELNLKSARAALRAREEA